MPESPKKKYLKNRLEEKWENLINKKEINLAISNRQSFIKFEIKLFEFLREIIFIMKGIIDGRHLGKNKKEIILKIKKQLHLKNLGLISEEWKDKIEGNKKKEIFKILFFEGEEGNVNDIVKLNEDFELWGKYKKQRDLGKRLASTGIYPSTTWPRF